MKYSLKEKIILYNRLQNQQSAQTDLQFLQEIQPELKIDKAWTMNPERYANKILYLLLDYASSEDIVKNRRASSPMKIYIPAESDVQRRTDIERYFLTTDVSPEYSEEKRINSLLVDAVSIVYSFPEIEKHLTQIANKEKIEDYMAQVNDTENIYIPLKEKLKKNTEAKTILKKLFAVFDDTKKILTKRLAELAELVAQMKEEENLTLKEDIEDKNNELEETKDALQEAEERADEAEARASQAEAKLEEEKKKD